MLYWADVTSLDITTLPDLVNKYGPMSVLCMFLALLYWDARKERLASQKRERKQSIVLIKALNSNTNALRTLRSMLLKGQVPEPGEYEPEDPNEFDLDEDGDSET